MFTGLISAVGRIADTQPLGDASAHGRRLVVETPADWLADVQLGDSIAINGACMTVTSMQDGRRFRVDVSAESLQKTAGFDVSPSEQRPVNLEKALRANDRLGGHLVAGHVDGIGRVSHFAAIGESWQLCVEAPAALAKFLAYKGSITVNGVSLTVNRVTDQATGRCEFAINLIPHTVAHTALGSLTVGDAVNLEVDLIARYVERMLGQAPAGGDHGR